MSYRYTLEAVLEGLHEIEDLIKGFPSDGKIPDIEIDLTLQKIRNLYELLLMMIVVAAGAAGAERKTMAAAAEEKTTAAGEAAVVEKRTGKKDPVKDTAPASTPVTTAATATASAAAPPPAASPQTIADQFKGKTTLHESLHQTVAREEDTLAHAKPVTHLLSAIGINDRFTFIRELFNNDTHAFENTISILNDSASFNDAYNHMIQHFDWDMDSEVVQQLLDIIRRKFIKGRHE